jgi:hypothetical protein
MLFDSDGTTLLNTITATDDAVTQGTIVLAASRAPWAARTLAWSQHSNAKQRGVDWQFRIDDARTKLNSKLTEH